MEEDPASRMVYLQGRMALLDEIAEEHWESLLLRWRRKQADLIRTDEQFAITKVMEMTEKQKQKRVRNRTHYRLNKAAIALSKLAS